MGTASTLTMDVDIENLLFRLDGSLVRWLYTNFDSEDGQRFFHGSTAAVRKSNRERVMSILSALHFILKTRVARGWKVVTQGRLNSLRHAQYTTAGVRADMDELQRICNAQLNDGCVVQRRTHTPGTPPGSPTPEVIPKKKKREYVEKRERPTSIIEDGDTRAENVLHAVIHKRPVVAGALNTLNCLTKLKHALHTTPFLVQTEQLYRELKEELSEYIDHYERGIKEALGLPLAGATHQLVRGYRRQGSRAELVYGTRHTLGWVILKRNRLRPPDTPLWRTIRDVREAMGAFASAAGAPLMGSDACPRILAPMGRANGRDTHVQVGTPSGRPVVDGNLPAERRLGMIEQMEWQTSPSFGNRTLLYGVGTGSHSLEYVVTMFDRAH
jgi:hypothetical protein